MAKPTFKNKVTKKEAILLSSGDWSIQYAEQIKDELILLLESGKDVQLNLEQVTLMDTIAIQLIFTLKLGMEKQGRKISIALPANQAFQNLLQKAGITHII